MSESKFKVGDRVRVVGPGQSADGISDMSLEIGAEYTVSDYGWANGWDTSGAGYHAFELVAPERDRLGDIKDFISQHFTHMAGATVHGASHNDYAHGFAAALRTIGGMAGVKLEVSVTLKDAA